MAAAASSGPAPLMNGNVIDGKAVADQIRAEIATEVAELKAKYKRVGPRGDGGPLCGANCRQGTFHHIWISFLYFFSAFWLPDKMIEAPCWRLGLCWLTSGMAAQRCRCSEPAFFWAQCRSTGGPVGP